MIFIKSLMINDLLMFSSYILLAWSFFELKFCSDVPQLNYDGCNGDPYLIFIKHLKPYFWYLNDTNKICPDFKVFQK